MRGIIIGCLTALGQNHVWGGRLEGSIEFPRESFIVLTGCQWGLQQCGKGHLTLAVSRRAEKPGGLSPRRSALSPTGYCAPSATEMSLDMGSAAWAPGMPPCLVNRLVCGGEGTAQMEGIVRAADVSRR